MEMTLIPKNKSQKKKKTKSVKKSAMAMDINVGSI